MSDDLAVIQTVDFFTPIVDDPYVFGQIAAANALSDVYAMGGEPTLAMNLLCIPTCLEPDTVRKILEGGHSKTCEAGCIVAGGHTIMDSEPKYGLSVMGLVHPDHILKNVGAQVGDVLVLTKPLGSGVLSTAIKFGMIQPSQYETLIATMAELNAASGKDVREADNVHACTDVTGFGLLGHASEMAEGSNVTIQLETQSLPLMEGAAELARQQVLTGGGSRNLDFVKPRIADSAPQELVDICADPQTSGGLLVALPQEDAEKLLAKLRIHAPASCIVGRVLPREEASVVIV